jgi:CheY-like chemotaxis protein
MMRSPPVGPPHSKILIVDDDSQSREIVAGALRARGFEVIVRSTGVGSQAVILREHPDLVIVEAELPLLSGEELVRAMRRHASLCEIPVLLYGADRRLAKECGADGVAAKTEAASVVREAISLLGRARKGVRDGYVLVACDAGSGSEIVALLPSELTVHVTDSGTEALRHLCSRDPPVLLVLGTELDDLPSERVMRAALDNDARWSRRTVVWTNDALPEWAAGLVALGRTSPIDELRQIVDRMRRAA